MTTSEGLRRRGFCQHLKGLVLLASSIFNAWIFSLSLNPLSFSLNHRHFRAKVMASRDQDTAAIQEESTMDEAAHETKKLAQTRFTKWMVETLNQYCTAVVSFRSSTLKVTLKTSDLALFNTPKPCSRDIKSRGL